MEYGLPESVELNGSKFAIKSDFRNVLAILEAMADPNLPPEEQQEFALRAFYFKADLEEMPKEWIQEAYKKLCWFIAGGREQQEKGPKLMDWAKDYPLIIGPVNRVMGGEIRGKEKVHWWSFLDAYMEIGDCLFAQVVRIRKKKAEHKKLDKWEQEFYKKNRDMIEFRGKKGFTEKNMDFFASLKG